METKLCVDCLHTKPVTEFATHPRSGYQCRCKLCQRIKSKEWYQANSSRQKANVARNTKRHKDAFSAWKQTLSCPKCGESFHACLDFHHLYDKDIDISTMVTLVSVDRLVAELNKCVVLCSNCHRKLHAGNITSDDVPPLRVTADLIFNTHKE